MSTPTSTREPSLAGHTVVLVGGSAGIGLATARRARVEGAEVILTGPNRDRLEAASAQVGALRTAAFDANAETWRRHCRSDGLSQPTTSRPSPYI